MAADHQPKELLEFSDDLHYEDVTPLRHFLAARLAEIVEAQPEGSDARFAAERLADITANDCVQLGDLLGAWSEVVVEGRVDQPGQTQRLRQDVMIWWGRLCVTADRFRDHPDHRSRWRALQFMNLAHAEFMASLTDAAGGTYGDGAHP
ncbi:hypothetical protein [Streptomyces sp. FH025]|uniref:hypothetical protein n=1 Tax=Streptomyces sp. FH025 TaxID=2815937 RepID=UPI001A9D1572|nr:hypothetical protein [Streptomyces sp. FH025]MBO1415891.1 hypothetical protein [Streptomyces sp. FH025]